MTCDVLAENHFMQVILLHVTAQLNENDYKSASAATQTIMFAKL